MPGPEAPTAVVELTAALAAIDSTNPTLVPGGAGEAEIGEYVAAWMQARGWQVEVQAVAPGRPNVIGRIAGGPGPVLLVNAHLDTVGASAAAREVRREGDRLHGRGVLDTKGGLAAALTAGMALEAPPPGDVVIAAVCDEEDASLGTAALLGAVRADAAVVLEPTDLVVGVRHRGFAVIEGAYEGLAAHTAHREQGRNAIDAAVRMAKRLDRLDTAFAATPATNPVEQASVQITRISGGSEVFTIPDRCEVVVEVRTVAPTAAADIELVRAAMVADDVDGITATASVVLQQPPLGVPDDCPVARALLHAGAAGVGPLPFWTDAALQAAAGIPSVVFGPGGEGIHSDDEHVRCADLERCRDSLHHVMSRFGAADRAPIE